ncbi:MAG: adenylate/guanylate cyclase domain-containing protein, partial [Candidatus Hydrogenedentales bacterium]
MQCASCGETNRDGARFCDTCGAALSMVCPKCEAALRPHARFCDRCGHNLRPETPKIEAAESAPAIGASGLQLAKAVPRLRERLSVHGERRIVTVMFVDAVDHTKISETLGEETMYGLVQGCYDRMRDAAHRYDGTVQFTGDGIFALFGAPVAYEDSGRRAVAAAVEIRNRLDSYAADIKTQHNVTCRYRFGLNTGPVVVGNITDDRALEYTAVGDTVNLASRMETLAEPGEIYMTETTFKAVRDYYECERVGDLKVKGKQRPVTAYRVVREKPVQTRIEAAANRGLTPYTGREQELTVLQSFWKQAEQGRGHIALLSGEAGMGKSRLLFEFRHMLEGEHALWIEGQCTTFGENVAYLPFINFLKKSFGIREGDHDRAMQDKIRETSANWDAKTLRAVPYLKYLLNLDPEDDGVMKMDPMERRAGIIESYRALMWQMAHTQPLVLVVEDLHWIDRKSMELLEALVESVVGQPVLMILTHRPEYRHSLGERSFVSRVALAPLTPAETRSMACRLLHVNEIDPALDVFIQQKAEGNPFYVEEVTRSLIETGALRRSNGAYALTSDASRVHVPDSIQEIILARLDRLEGPAREAIQVASVVGREFTGWLVERLTQAKEEGAAPLNELKALELIYENAYFPELSYMFKHALTHEVAYSTLVLTRRRDLHRMVATVIEELYADRLPEQYEMLARHYCEAEEWDKALEYLEKAGDKAIANYANQEALQFFGKILDICDRQPDRAYFSFAFRAGMQRGWVNFLIGHYLEGVEDMNRVIAKARNHGDLENERLATIYRGWFEKYAHEFEQCEETLRTIVATPETKLDDQILISGAVAWYALCKVTNRHEEANRFAINIE